MADKSRMIFIFIDGFGIGEPDGSKNPLYAAPVPGIDKAFESGTVYRTDACLGVPGLPQSATGQTAIFTGVNAPMVLGRHLHGQPTVTLKRIINRDNLFKALIRMGLAVTNSNVYRNQYLEGMLNSRDRRHRPSVTSVMTMSCGMQFRTVEHYNRGEGVYHDVTGNILADSGYDAEVITPEEAAGRLYKLSRSFDFTLFEHFMTDIIGHKGDIQLAASAIKRLDAFLGALLKLVDLESDIVIITSDHGNIEDISVRTHTVNSVPTAVIGAVPGGTGSLDIKSLVDIMPAVVEIFRRKGNG